LFGIRKKSAAHCTRKDVEFFLLLCFARAPKHEGELTRFAKMKPFSAARSILGSYEFSHNFLEPLLLGKRPAFHSFRNTEKRALRAGFKSLLGGKLSKKCNTWVEALETAISLPRFMEFFEAANTGYSLDQIRRHLECMPPAPETNIIGTFDEVSPSRCSGYVLDLKTPSNSLTLDIFVNDAFVGQCRQTLLRRDLQEKHGGPGKYGFELEYGVPKHLTEHKSLVLRAFDHATGQPAFAAREFAPIKTYQRDTVAKLTSELETLRDALATCTTSDDKVAVIGHVLEKLEEVQNAMPTIDRAAGVRLEDYLTGKDSFSNVREVKGSPKTQLLFANEDSIEKGGDDDLLLFSDADTLISEHAQDHFAVAADAHPDALVFYADYETRVPGSDNYKPYFRAEFDVDLLIQDPNYSAFFAVRKKAMPHPESKTNQALWLRLLADNGPTAFHHIPLLLGQLEGQRAPIDRTLLTQSLKDIGYKAEITPHKDGYGRPLAGYARANWQPEGNSAQKMAIIIPSRDNLAMLKPCIESLQATLKRADQSEIIIVDNGSKEDQTLAWLKHLQESKQATVVTHDAPFNWAELNNLAAAATDADYLLFLNDDTRALDIGWDDILRGYLAREDVGVVGARLLYEDGTLQHGGVVINDLTKVRSDAIMHEAAGQSPSQGGYAYRSQLTHEASAVTGAFLACRKSDFDTLDGFDAENFAVAFNDIDYCLRSREKGLRTLYVPALTFMHLESKSRGYDSHSDDKAMRVKAEHEAMVARWEDRFDSDPYYAPAFMRRGRPFNLLKPQVQTDYD
jgi:GT2 family glycosyltransferase